MRIDDLDKALVRRTALRMIDASPTGVRTTEVAAHADVAESHSHLREANEQTYISLIGKILGKYDRVIAVEDENAPATKDTLWKRA